MSYTVGDTLTFTATFNVGGVLTDPGAVTFTLENPSGASTDYVYGVAPEVTKVAVGSYSASVALGAVGTWTFTWTGTTPAVGVSTGSRELLRPHRVLCASPGSIC